MAVSAPTLRCLVVDAHPLMRAGVRQMLEQELAPVEVQAVDDRAAAREAIAAHAPDVIVIDPDRVDGTSIAALVGELGAPVVVFTGEGGARLLSEALRAGAKGFVRKDSPAQDLLRAIRAAQAGDFYVDPALSSSIVLDDDERRLTERQREILQLLADGRQTDEVARQLGLSTETVRTHTKRILAKLGADTRTQAVAIALRGELIR